MALKYTTLGTLSTVVSADLDALADDAGAVGATAYDNTVGATLGRFEVAIAAQASARAADAQVSLVLVPEGASGGYGSTASLRLARGHVAREVTGRDVTWPMDAATTARVLSVDGVRVPHGRFTIGLLNETGQALATGNTIKMALYSIEDV